MPIPFAIGGAPTASPVVNLGNTDFTTTGLLASVRRRGVIPAASDTMSDADILAIATEEMRTSVMSFLLSTKEEFSVATFDTTILAGSATYRIPGDAIGGKVREALYAQDGLNFSTLNRYDPENAPPNASTGDPIGYVFEGNSVTIVPTPAGTGTLRLKYFRRPNNLIQTGAYGVVTAIDTIGLNVVVGAAPSTFSAISRYDFISATPSFDTLAAYVTPSVLTVNTLTLTTIPTGLAIGDYVCLSGDSPVPQIPVEMHSLLVECVLARCWEALGNQPKLAAAEKLIEAAKTRYLSLLTPRDEGSHRPITSQSGPGWNRGGRIVRR